VGKTRLLVLGWLIAAVAIGGVIAWTYHKKTQPFADPIAPTGLPVGSSAFFQTNPLIGWGQNDLKKRIDEFGAKRLRKQTIQHTQTFLTLSSYAFHPQPAYAPIPLVELVFRDAQKADHEKSMSACHVLMNFNPSAWESLDAVAGVGNGLAGPLVSAVPLVAQPHLRKLIRDQDDNVVIVVTHRGNSVFNGPEHSNRKSDQEMFRGDAAEADHAFRKLRGELEEKLRQLEGALSDPVETLDGIRLLGFSFNYTVGSYRGRVEGKLEPQGANAYQVRLDMEERRE